MEEQQTTDRRVWLGVALLLIGGAWLLDNLNIIPFNVAYYIFSWKTLLIFLGIFFITVRNKMLIGVILIAVGGLYWLRDLDVFYFHLNIGNLIWPAVIIAIGVSLITRRSFRGESLRAEDEGSEDVIDDFAIFGGGDRTISTQNFSGGKVTAMFGGSELDMRGAALAPGKHILDIFVMFGGTHIIVPPDWTIKVEVFSILGGFSDKRYSTLKVIPDPDKVLIIKGFVMFGGGEVSLTK